MNVLVLLAGGVGSRMLSSLPKQFLEVNGVPIIGHAVMPFLAIEKIHCIIIVCHKEYVSYMEKIFEGNDKITVIEGGSTRFCSCKNAIEFLQNKHVKSILFHDAARPLVTKEIIKNCLDALNLHKAVTVAIPAKDTIIQVKDGVVSDALDRSKTFINQTPQCFHFSVIHSAYINAKHENFTDDVSVVMHGNKCAVHIVQGSERNIKITHKQDLALMEILLKN